MSLTDPTTFSDTSPGVAVRSRRASRSAARPPVQRVRHVPTDTVLPAPPTSPRLREASFAIVLLGAVAVLAAAWIDTGPGSWYASLPKPRFTSSAPAVLGLGLLTVCAATALAVWLLVPLRHRRDVIGALAACLVQFALLLALVWTMFVAHRLERAFVLALVLIVSSTLTVAAFGRISRAAGALMVPALGWAVAITGLTGGVAVLD